MEPAPPRRAEPLGRNVWALNFTSFFTDVGTEMIFPMLPAFLTTVLGASAEALGLMEGVADTVAASLKLASGWLLDRWPRPKGIALLGYALSSALRPVVSIAAAPWQVLAIRAGDRVGKGIRGTAADALLSAEAKEGESGRVFGSNRAMDNLGALVGPLVATALLARFGGDLRRVFFWAWVPGVLAVASLALGVKARPRDPPPRPSPAGRGREEPIAGDWTPSPAKRGRDGEGGRELLSPIFYLYLAIVGVFALASSSDAFLLLRATDLGVAQVWLPTLWVLLNFVKAVSSYPLGAVSDRLGKAPTLVAGFLWYAASYAGFALVPRGLGIWFLFPLYGVFYGLTEGVGKALVADLTPASRKGWAFGLYNAVTGLMALPAGLLTGVLWRRVSGPAALWTCAGLAIAAALALLALSGALKGRQGPAVSARY